MRALRSSSLVAKKFRKFRNPWGRRRLGRTSPPRASTGLSTVELHRLQGGRGSAFNNRNYHNLIIMTLV
jgi:hypothetical protein